MPIDVFLFQVPSDPVFYDVRLRDLAAGGSGDAIANGSVVLCSATLVAGHATGTTTVFTAGGLPPMHVRIDATARGRLVKCSSRVFSGTAIGERQIVQHAVAHGGRSGCYATVINGRAAGERNLYDDEILILLEAA